MASSVPKLIQPPNLPLIVALAAFLLRLVVSGPLAPYLAAVFYMAMSVWAYLEITEGVNWLRKLLGVLVLLYILVRLAQML